VVDSRPQSLLAGRLIIDYRSVSFSALSNKRLKLAAPVANASGGPLRYGVLAFRL